METVNVTLEETEDLFMTCSRCGYELIWEDCALCDGSGYMDAYDDDPFWYDPGDIRACSECGGYGGWWWCPNEECQRK